MRAKLVISSVTQFEGDNEQLTFRGVCRSDSYPADGSDENNTYAKFSPSVELKMTISNPALYGNFKPGHKFYCDFTETI